MSAKSVFYNLVSLLSRPVIWLLLKAGKIIMAKSWFFVRAALYAKNKTGASTKTTYRLVASHFGADRLVLPYATQMQKLGVAIPASLTAELFLRQAYTGGLVLPERKITNKPGGTAFARQLGLKVPEVFYDRIPLVDIPPQTGVVVKPVGMYGARGVFIVQSESDILALSARKTLHSWDQMIAYAKKLLKSNTVEHDSWMVQQYISDEHDQAAMDVKIFMFYGELAMTAEMVRYPRILCDFRDDKGEVVPCRLYGKKDQFVGPGVSESELLLARKVSLEIPVPFMRIDFLRGADGLYFGEFTSIPSSIGLLGKKLDHELGIMHRNAEARLTQDLLSGKKFEAYQRIN